MGITEVDLKVGDRAPEIKAMAQFPSGEVKMVDLPQTLVEGYKVLLVFYPGDDTPGCTAQLCGIRDIYSEYQKHKVVVWGVNPADSESHKKFIEKYNFQFPIIIDQDKSIRKSYGAEKSFFKNITTKRGVFLIDTSGKISYIHWGQQDNDYILEQLSSKQL